MGMGMASIDTADRSYGTQWGRSLGFQFFSIMFFP